ncbi:MAG: PAS/PAC sensor-containing diguanylate cyclase/phosphodiesterase [Methylococcaceae bacterium NSM2-1]|jgi:diguanylate cyclase (GGDEF)-like protein/PAS domain S-box-containing protein|nr:MAG: PAS/PAC sensor-containing diguanylate cyclase/phosphodiesterase [Methylococcaceae bacterium NSM2-1]
MNKFVGNLSIKRKLLLTVIFPSVISLLFAGLILVVLEIAEFQKNTRDDLSTLAAIIGNRSTAALLFQDLELANENLGVLNTLPAVQAACLYDARGAVFARLLKTSHERLKCPLSIKDETTRFENVHLLIVQPIVVDSELLGSVYIHADFSQSYWRKIQFTGLLFLVLVGVSILTFFISAPLLRLISSPIKKLVNTVKAISDTKDYSLRAVKVNNDELGVLVDAFNDLISTVEAQNQSLTRAKDRYLALYDDNPTMVFNLSEYGLILSVNRTGAKQLGLAVEELQGCSVFHFIHPIDLPVMHALVEHCLMNPLSVHKQELRQVCDNGRIIWVRATARLFENEQRQSSLLLVCEDVTEAHDLSEQIAYQASHDALTGLANRSEFDRHVIELVTLVHADRSEHALCYLDLDQFKVVNDTSGHLAGDELLRQLGDLLRKNLRRHDFVARLGGDEFGVLMYNCSLSEAFQACEKIRDIVRDFHFGWEDRSFTVGVSIGVTSINTTSGNAVDLLKEADAACYAAKDKGRNRVHVFRPDDEELALRHGEMQWVSKIQQGLAQNRFCLFGQPIVPLSGNEEKLHFETLVRYRDDKGHIIPPGAFFPAAERYNLASALDRSVISHLFEWIAKKPDFLENLSICSVNLSGVSLSDESMLAFISEQFSLWAIPTHKVCFEITETAAIANLSCATKFINHLRERGCSFSLDDFGSGLSSFAYLKNLPVDFLKIDGLFVKDIVVDEVDLAMVRAINEVGHIMGKKTIAEFVENEQIFNLLNELGVDYAQGYGIGKPVPLDELTLIKPFTVSSI